MTILIKNWSSFQSYKDRKPPWIRLHKSLLDDFQFQKMSVNSRALLPMLWLLASEDEEPTSGKIRFGYEEIAFRLRLPIKDIVNGVKEISLAGFISEEQQVTGSLQDGHEKVTPETETETETETKEQVGENLFDQFWSAYPKKKKKGDAEKAFKSAKITEGFLPLVLDAIKKQATQASWLKENGQYIPYPATWLRSKGWEDDLDQNTLVNTGQSEAEKTRQRWEEEQRLAME